MKKKFFFLLVFGLMFSLFSAQEKKRLLPLNELLKKVVPNEKYNAWGIYYVENGEVQELKKMGSISNKEIHSEGFELLPNNTSGAYYYVTTINAKGKNFITQAEDFRKFIGKVDNVEEAAILATLEGYFVDYDYKDYAANYHEDTEAYYLELGKVVSTECPFQKNHFMITDLKNKTSIKKIEDVGKYAEVYVKKCTNNPTLLKLKQKYEEEKQREEERNNPKKIKRK